MDKVSQPLRVLVVEDNPNDAELMLRELRRAHFEPQAKRVDTEAEYRAALDADVDLILSDYAMPQFNGLRALEILKESKRDVPFIIVSGSIGEETAVTAMRSGAADYLLKDRLTRLGQAVEHALEQKQLQEERRRAEEAMEQSEHKYRHLFESLGEAAFLIDAKSRRILDANLCAETSLGRTRTEILGMNEAMLFPPNKAADYCGKLASAGEDGKRELDEAEIQSKDGTRIPVLVSVAPIQLYGRDLVLALMADVTERKRAEEALNSLQREYKLILNSAGEGIHGLDLDGNIIFENPKAGELLGWKTDELLGKPAHATMHHTRSDGSQYPVEECPIYASIRDGATRRTTNDVFWRRDGSSFRVDYISAPIKDERGQVRGCIVTFKDITEQFVAEARRKLQAEQYRLLFETNPNSMWVFDTKSLQILAVNQAATKQYGYSREEFLKLTLTDLRSAEDAPDLVKSVTSSGSPAHFSGQFRHIGKDGSVILVDIYSGPIVWEGVAARIVSAIDVTERKRASERMQAILESALDCIITMDHQGRVVEFNPAAEKTFGYRRAEAVGQLLSELIIPPSLRERHQKGLSRYLSTGDAPVIGKHIELSAIRKDGTEFPVELAITRIGSQEPPMFTGFIRDITERKQAEGRLREQARLLDLAQDAIMVRDMEDRVEFWNQGAEKLYGWTAEEVQGKKASDFLHEDEPAATAAARAAVLEDGKFTGECKHICKDGGTVMVRSRWSLVRDELAAPKSILIINTDVTEQKKLETHLLRAQRLESIGTLASGVAHDLNNVLTPILMCAQTLRGDLLEEDRQSALSMIEDSAHRGAGIVKQVLTFARGVEGERVLIKPSHLIEEMIDIARKTFPKSIEISSRYSEDLWSIQGDPTQLHQVLLNLSVNARDAMPNGGALVIHAENFNVDEYYASMTPDAKLGQFVALRVSDTGAGMPRAIIDKIFDPFFTTKEVGKGTGLGLSTALGIVKSHGGFISVYSEPGKGTTFKLFLPATTTHADLQQSKTSVVPIQGNGELILMVDDEPNILSITKMILEKHRYGVVSASDGSEALAIFAQQMQSIRLVVTDISMPYMDGVALASALRKMKPDVPIIALTGEAQQVRLEELRTMNVNNFLIKPFSAANLLAAVHASVSTVNEVKAEVSAT